MAKGTQWHPVFAQMLKDLVGRWYEVETEVPVSELPRQGDLFVVRRQDAAEPPFTGAWLHLTDWNVFKGLTDEAEEEDLDLLSAVGTGLNVRMNEQRKAAKLTRTPNGQVSFWYLVPSLGEKFMGHARARATWTYETGGLWRTRVWNHPVWLYAYEDAAVELDAVPFFLMNRDRPAPLRVGELIADRADLREAFTRWVRALQPALWEEMRQMNKSPNSIIDWEAVAKVTDVADVLHVLPNEVIVQYLTRPGALEPGVLQRLLTAAGTSSAGAAEATLKALLDLLPPERVQAIIEQRAQEKR